MVQRLGWWLAAMWIVAIWLTPPVNASATLNPQPPMVIEWLKFKVPTTQRDRYLTLDNEIWTSALVAYPGFLDKTTWLDPNHDDEVIFVISWATREQWKAIPEDELDQINQRFDEALGFDYEMLESKEFVVPASAAMDAR
ncbi:TIGR03792 family protein [Leptothoe spongobia]|nr:TIGR03792 family protein [Leptothoe spongobia]